MRFIANLRQETIDAFASQEIQPAAYLLSAHRVTPATLRAADDVRDRGLDLFADNGTKPLIDTAIGVFQQRAKDIRTAVRELGRKLGRSPRMNDIPPELRQPALALANEVVQHATSVSDAIDHDELLEVQLSMNPTHVIAKEDFATACLIALDLEREITGWCISEFEARNRRGLTLWKRVADDPRCKNIKVHAVLSAVDYNTARAVGQLAAREGVQHVAIGIAGITLDPSAIDFFLVGRSEFSLPKAAPRRFVRFAQVLRGFADGYADVGSNMTSFHCLGLGSSVMLPIAAAALPESTSVTADATSPVLDAVRDLVMYDIAKRGDRATTAEIVERIIRGEDQPISGLFVSAFQQRFGHDPKKARDYWEAQGRPAITSGFLKTRSELTAALPLFTEADPEIRTIASKTRIAHNHWVLSELCMRFVDGVGRQHLAFAALDDWTVCATGLSTKRGVTAAKQVLTS